jgi:hemolysin E
MKELTAYQKDYSTTAGEIVGRVTKLLFDSRDHYLAATQSVYEWCGLASNLLAVYIKLFAGLDQGKAVAQKAILVKLLADGEKKLGDAQTSLQESSISFNGAAGEISTLKTQLSNDFTAGSTYYEGQVNKLRTEAYAGAAVGLVAGPFGLIISYSIAAGVVEGQLVPALMAKFDEIKNAFARMGEIVNKADTDITKAKAELQVEIRKIGELKTQAETTGVFVEYDDLVLKELKDAAKTLIAQCDEYRERHGGQSIL